MNLVANSSLKKLNFINNVIAVPSNNEVTAIPILIKKLPPLLSSEDAILILDDSPTCNKRKIQLIVSNRIKLRDYDSKIDLLIGGRYLSESQIVDWSVQRKIFSKLINFVVPRLLRIPVKAITNGLGRYSLKAINCIFEVKLMNNVFTYLSEKILSVRTKGLSILELPMVFINRVSGTSTVTYKEFFNSVKVILQLLFYKKRLNA